MEKENKTFEQFCDPALRRSEQMKVKSEAVWKIFLELDSLINVSKFAKQYFKKSHSWFLQKVNGYDVNHKRAEFTPEEYDRISASFRDLAQRLNDYADELDKAKICED